MFDAMEAFWVLLVVFAATFFVGYQFGSWQEREWKRQLDSEAGSVTQRQRRHIANLCRRFDVAEPDYAVLTYLEARLLIEEPKRLLPESDEISPESAQDGL